MIDSEYVPGEMKIESPAEELSTAVCIVVSVPAPLASTTLSYLALVTTSASMSSRTSWTLAPNLA